MKLYLTIIGIAMAVIAGVNIAFGTASGENHFFYRDIFSMGL